VKTDRNGIILDADTSDPQLKPIEVTAVIFKDDAVARLHERFGLGVSDRPSYMARLR